MDTHDEIATLVQNAWEAENARLAADVTRAHEALAVAITNLAKYLRDQIDKHGAGSPEIPELAYIFYALLSGLPHAEANQERMLLHLGIAPAKQAALRRFWQKEAPRRAATLKQVYAKLAETAGEKATP